MSTQTLIKHVTKKGYEAELLAGNVCERCRAAKRVYSSQYSKGNKARGIKYSTTQVIDHLDRGKTQTSPARSFARSVGHDSPRDATPSLVSDQDLDALEVTTESRTEPSVSDRLRGALGGMVGETYVQTDDAPDYLHQIEPDPEPAMGDWDKKDAEEYVITAKGYKLIEDNLATYLSVVGITLEMIDPYCGPILAENIENIVNKWTKVIARYPKAAQLFMSEEGGTIMTWIGAIQATWPVLYAIYEHHLNKSVTVENGKVFKRKPGSRVKPSDIDATTPPMPDYDYSVE